jgi:hypothetical protein
VLELFGVPLGDDVDQDRYERDQEQDERNLGVDEQTCGGHDV